MKKDPVPSSCLICRLNIFQTAIKRCGIDWKEDSDWRWMCQHCGSMFTWSTERTRVRNIDTAFMWGVQGNIDVERINLGLTQFHIEPKIPDEFDPKGYNHSRNFN